MTFEIFTFTVQLDHLVRDSSNELSEDVQFFTASLARDL
jgi:hypothetical protein